jgi:hypothetical protein
MMLIAVIAEGQRTSELSRHMMQTPDLSPLVRGIIVIIGIAIALWQYTKLERWAKLQAIEAIEWKQGLPYFFSSKSNSINESAHLGQHSKQNFKDFNDSEENSIIRTREHVRPTFRPRISDSSPQRALR